jgi:hypothetical protein
MKRFITFSTFLITTCFLMTGLNAQDKKQQKQEEIKSMVQNNHYVFEANYVIPQHGGGRQLTDISYDLRISKDSVIAYLPYFGRAFIAPAPGTDEGGIKFTSTDFTYQQKAGKKGSWQVFIKPKDGNGTNWRDVQQMTLNISADGYASLVVISTNRDPISFEGDIIAKEE